MTALLLAGWRPPSNSESDSLGSTDSDSDTGTSTVSYESDYEMDPLGGRRHKSSYIERKTQLKTDGQLLSLHRGGQVVEGDTLKQFNVFQGEMTAIDELSTKLIKEIRHNTNHNFPTQSDSLLLVAVEIMKAMAHQTKQAVLSYADELDKVRRMQSLINLRARRNLAKLFKYLGNDVHDPNYNTTEFTIRNTIGELRLMVALPFAELLPSEVISPGRREHYIRLINGIGWSKFLERIMDYHRTHYEFFLPKDGIPMDARWTHWTSVFSNFQNKFFESSYLTSNTVTRRGDIQLPSALQNSAASDNHFQPHDTDISLRVGPSGPNSYTLSTEQHRASGRNPKGSPAVLESPVRALRFYVPMLIWSYNVCKECLILLDALIAQRPEVPIPDSSAGSASADRKPKMKAEVEYSAGFQHGSAVNVRRRLARAGNLVKLGLVIDAEEKEAAVKDTTKSIIALSNVGEAGEMEDAVRGQDLEDNLRKERRTFLDKLNSIKKCLIILTNDRLLNIVLNLDISPTGQDRTPGEGSRSVAILAKQLEADLLFVAGVLRKSDADYDSNPKNLLSTEREFDSFVSTAVGSGSSCCDDYKILLALLEKLNPVIDGSSNISSGSIRDSK